MQQRESVFAPRDTLEDLLSRSDAAALDFVTDRLLAGGDLDDAPPAAGAAHEPVYHEAG
jgi:hypothetical protein